MVSGLAQHDTHKYLAPSAIRDHSQCVTADPSNPSSNNELPDLLKLISKPSTTKLRHASLTGASFSFRPLFVVTLGAFAGAGAGAGAGAVLETAPPGFSLGHGPQDSGFNSCSFRKSEPRALSS